MLELQFFLKRHKIGRLSQINISRSRSDRMRYSRKKKQSPQSLGKKSINTRKQQKLQCLNFKLKFNLPAGFSNFKIHTFFDKTNSIPKNWIKRLILIPLENLKSQIFFKNEVENMLGDLYTFAVRLWDSPSFDKGNEVNLRN